MTMDRSIWWRVLFVVGGALFIAGAFYHPRDGSMAEMLAQPVWVPAHSVIFVAWLLLAAGLVQLRRSAAPSKRLDRWLFFTLVATVLEAIEMAVHTAAAVDAEALAAGGSTPVFTTHMWLVHAVYPLYAVCLIGLIWIGQRERALGSSWISWIGILGAVAHAAAPWLAVVLEIRQAGILFPIGGFALPLWFLLAGVWPLRKAGRAATPEPAAAAATAG